MRTILAGLAILLALHVLPRAFAVEPPPRPHIVFLLADDLGSYDVGWRGSQIKTPHLDQLARDGARLEQFYVQPVCSPTRAALMTGRYPFRYGFQVGVVRPWADYGLSLEERMLPQALHEAGYATAIVGKWHLGHVRPEFLPTRRGFDHQYGHYNGALDYFTHIRDNGFDWHRDDRESRDEGYTTHLIADEAVRIVKQHDAKKPLFLYVPFNAVHAPHQVPEKYSQPYTQFSGQRRIYAGMLTAMDEAIGRIVAAVDEQGMRGNTLFIFSSDNGGPRPGAITSNGPLRAGKGTVYEGGVRVAALAAWQGQIKPGSTVNSSMHMVDWYPTLINLAGASMNQQLPVDGVDMLSALKGYPVVRSNPLIVNNIAPRGGAIRVGDWKLVVNGQVGTSEGDEAPGEDGPRRVELFDLSQDRSEKNDRSKAEPGKLNEMMAQYNQLAEQAVPPKTKPKPAGFKTPRVWGQAD